MKKILITFAIILAIIVAITLIVLTIFLFKPNADINGLRDKMEVSQSDSELTDCVHFLRTDSSDCIIIESNGHFAMVDAGEDNDNPRGFESLVYDGYEQEILDYLKKNCVSEDGKVYLDFVLGTHSHSDHIGGFDTVIADEDIIIEKAYLKVYDESQIREHEVVNWDNKEVYEQMVKALNEKNIPIISEMDNTPFKLGNFTITLFNTEDNNTEPVGENDNSLGVLVEKNGARIFLAGDIDNINKDEERLAPQIGKVDVLKVGHHSYSKSTSPKWLKTLKPNVCVVTNEFEKTDKRTLRRIERITKAPILVTGKENGVIIQVDDNGKLSYYNNIH